jgi:DNA-binding HxlR family transcriptional regulator
MLKFDPHGGTQLMSAAANGIMPACPISELLAILSAKWTVEIMRELAIGPTRTRRFLALTPGLTMKCLRQRLVQLQDYGLIERRQFDEKPLKVEYSLTAKGVRIADLLAVIKKVADEFGSAASCQCSLENIHSQEMSGPSDCTLVCPRRRERRKEV